MPDELDLRAPGAPRLVAAMNPGSSSPSVPEIRVAPGSWRGRVSRDLHDGVGQSITSLLVNVRVAIERGHAGRDELLIVEREAEAALNAIRALAYQVRRRSSLAEPLAQARRDAEQFMAAAGSSLRWLDRRPTGQLSPRVASALAGSIRESITNAVRHGRAQLVEVELTESDDRISVTVRDDGVGFVAESLQPTADGRGLGLLGNTERMVAIGGTFTINSRPGEGTVVVLEAPRFPARKLAGRRVLAPVSLAGEVYVQAALADQ